VLYHLRYKQLPITQLASLFSVHIDSSKNFPSVLRSQETKVKK